jgi:hypothetical protein
MACTAASRWAVVAEVDEDTRLGGWLVVSLLADTAATLVTAITALASSLRYRQYAC